MTVRESERANELSVYRRRIERWHQESYTRGCRFHTKLPTDLVITKDERTPAFMPIR